MLKTQLYDLIKLHKPRNKLTGKPSHCEKDINDTGGATEQPHPMEKHLTFSTTIYDNTPITQTANKIHLLTACLLYTSRCV